MIELKNVNKTYKSKKGEKCNPLKDISIKFEKNELVFLLGESGSGKTTFLNIISGIDKFDDGSICVLDNKIENMTQKQLDSLRKRDISIVFQSYNLLDELNVYDNIAIVLRLLGESEEAIEKKVDKTLKKLDLFELKNRKVNELSGGQKQRVAIARAIVKKSKIIFMDEPTGNLDNKNGEKIFDIISSLSKNSLIIVVTHDEKNAYKYADRIIKIKSGKVIQDDINNRGRISNIYIKNNTNELELISDRKSLVNYLENNINNLEKNDEINITLKIEYSKEKDEIEYSNQENTNEDKKIKQNGHLKIKDILLLGIRNFVIGKKQLIYTTVILMMSYIIYVFTTYIYTFDYKKSLENYIADNNIESFDLSRKTKYINRLGESIENIIYKGKETSQIINQNVDSEKVYYKKEDVNVVDKENEDNYITSVKMYCKSNMKDKILYGRCCEEKDDVVISEEFSKKLFGKCDESIINKKIIVDDKIELFIKGIYEDDNRKETSTSITVNIDYPEHYKDYKIMEIAAGDITKANSLKPYVSSSALYSSCENIKSDFLIKGRLPQNDNEILINVDKIYDESDLDKYLGTDGKKLKIRDLVKSEVDNAYDVMNMYDIFAKKAIIVGIVDSEKVRETLGDEYISDFYVRNIIFDKIKEEYKNYYWYDYICYEGDIDYTQLKKFEKEKIYISEDGCSCIYEMKSWIDGIGNVIILLDFFVGVLFIVAIMSYVYNMIRKKSKQIGILRSIGVPTSDIIILFEQNSILLTLICVILATPVILSLIKMLNVAIEKKYILETELTMFQSNNGLLTISAFVFVAVSIGLSMIPIVIMSKKTTAELMYEI